MTGRAAAKAGQGKKPAKPTPVKPEAQPAPPPAKRAKAEPGSGEIPQKEQNRMLAGIHYYAKQGSEGAKAALDMWGGLPVSQRKGFYDLWLANSTDKASRANYKWVYSLQKEVSRAQVVSTGSNKALRHGGEILGFAGLQWSDFENTDQALACIRRMVEKNRKEHEGEVFDPDDEDSEQPKLSRWCYVREEGVASRAITQTTTTVVGKAQLSQDLAQSCAQGVLGLETGAGTEACEDPERQAFLQANKHLASLVGALRKAITGAEDFQVRLEVQCQKDPALTTKVSSFGAKVAAERAWTQACAKQCQEWATFAGQDWAACVPKQDALSETAAAKLDAIRIACRDVAKFV